MTEGAFAIKQVNRDGSRSFGKSGESSFEILQMASDRDLAFWTGIQHAKVEIGAG